METQPKKHSLRDAASLRLPRIDRPQLLVLPLRSLQYVQDRLDIYSNIVPERSVDRMTLCEIPSVLLCSCTGKLTHAARRLEFQSTQLPHGFIGHGIGSTGKVQAANEIAHRQFQIAGWVLAEN